MSISKAQQEVLDKAKARIDFARTHEFCDWFRKENSYYMDFTDAEIYKAIDEGAKRSKWGYSLEWEMNHYEMNRNGIDYLCHASSATIKKLQSLGFIEIIRDSNGENYGFDTIKILNY